MSEITMTYILVGNHDMINNQQFLTDNHWMNGLKQWDNIVIVDHPVQLLHNERSYVFVHMFQMDVSGKLLIQHFVILMILYQLQILIGKHPQLFLHIKNLRIVKWVLSFHKMVIYGINHYLL